MVREEGVNLQFLSRLDVLTSNVVQEVLEVFFSAHNDLLFKFDGKAVTSIGFETR